MAHWGISKRSNVWLGLILFMALVWGASTSQASPISFDLSIEYSGATEPEGAPPWLTATFEDSGVDEVTLTLTALHLTGSEHVKDWGFNLNPSYDPTELGFELKLPKTGSFDAPDITTGTDFWQADGDGLYDIRFQFAAGGDSDTQFGVGDEAQFTITGNPGYGLTADSFDFVSEPNGGHGQYETAAHVVSIGEFSAWVATPEPATLAVLALGLLLSLLRKCRFPSLLRKRKA